MIWDLMHQYGPKYWPILIDLDRKATALRPDIMKNWERLALHLIGSGDYEEAIAVLREAVSKFPTEPRLHLILAGTYHLAQRPNLAYEVVCQAPAVPAHDRAMAIYRLEVLMKAEKDRSHFASNILALDPTNISALRVLGEDCRKNGTPEIMIPVCEAALEHEPGHTLARYELAIALTLSGRSEKARQLINLDRFITVTEVIAPQDYANAKTFETALTSEIMRNPTLKADPPDKATRGGLQTEDGLPHAGEPAISDLIKLIRSAVDAFEANLEDLDHPFVRRRPKQACLNAWAVVYRGDGRQVAHIHATAWLSGVYYVSVPKTLYDDQRKGCLVLGASELEGLSIIPPWGVRDIRPVPGRLVLFPSYVPHATISTGTTDPRICIAFDVKAISIADPTTSQ
jgi:uncharacterized protein (TIGR02466 family)